MEEMLDMPETETPEVPAEASAEGSAEGSAEEAPAEAPAPKVEGVRPAEGMPLPEKAFSAMTLAERAKLFADDPDGYRLARGL